MNRTKKFGIAGGSLFVVGIMFGWVIFPKVLKSQIKKQVALKPGTEMREMWSQFPLPLDFKVYLFNITNPEEITNGQKPKVNEVGPIFFDEYKHKAELVDREEDDSVVYKLKTTWVFNPSKTAPGISLDTEIVFPHLMMLGMVAATLRDKPTALGIVSKAIDSIFKKPESLFIKVKIRDILFDGLLVDCDVSDFAGSAVCSALKEQSEDLVEVGESQYKFSLFGAKNGTVLPITIRVYRGIKNYKDLGRVIEFKDQPVLDLWLEERCNQFNGTDSTIFPPLMSEEDDIVSFAPEMCRSLSAYFVKHSKTKGLKTLRYTADLGDQSSNPEDKCYCPAPDNCLRKGLFDLTKCVGVPIIGTLPHFYMTDELYLQQVDGLHPEKSKHEITMDFEPMTASPIHARKRLQFNMFIQPVPKVRLMKNFPEALLPLFWVEEGILLDDELVAQIKMAFKAMLAVKIIKWLMVLGGIGLGGYSAFLTYKGNEGENKLTVTKVSPQTGSAKNSGQEKKWPPINISTIQGATTPANP